jgi:DNA-binding response OmpR family regulator
MPKLSGRQLVRLARSWITALPVIVISGGLLTEDSERYLALGVSRILAKPFSSAQLLDAVNRILRCAERSPTRLHASAAIGRDG